MTPLEVIEQHNTNLTAAWLGESAQDTVWTHRLADSMALPFDEVARQMRLITDNVANTVRLDWFDDKDWVT